MNSMMDTWPIQMITFTAVLPWAFTTGDVGFHACAFTYISDITNNGNRMIRLVILDAVIASAKPTGNFDLVKCSQKEFQWEIISGMVLGSYIFTNRANSSYAAIYAMAASSTIAAIIYSFLRLEWQTTETQAPILAPNCQACRDLFDKENIVATFKTFVRPRQAHERLYLWILLVIMIISVFPKDELAEAYMYTSLTFDWNITTFSNAETLQHLFSAIGLSSRTHQCQLSKLSTGKLISWYLRFQPNLSECR